MNKTEILNIVNEPSKHIQIANLDGKASIVYSAKFVELLEAIPEMFTKADLVAILEDLRQDFIAEAYGIETDCSDYVVNVADIDKVIQEKIKSLRRTGNE